MQVSPGIFKAYDIRAHYPREINRQVIVEIARALACLFRLGKIIVGYDARLSSPKLYKALTQALLSANPKVRVVKAGLMTTPMLYFLVNYFKAQGGIMITASHNPKEYNGLKIVGPKAAPISGREIYELYKALH